MDEARSCLRLCVDFPSLGGVLIQADNVEVRVLEPMEEGRTGYIVFRGVDEKQDLIQSANYLYTPTSPGAVHSGFYEQASKVSSIILSTISEENSYILTGFGLGGALATIVLPYLSWWVTEAHIFASPRVYDPSAALEFDMVYRHLVHRWFHPMDIVCHYPFFGYRHVGTPHNILKDGMSWDSISELFPYHPSFPILNGVATIIQALLYSSLGEYHSVAVYQRHLEGGM